MPSITRSSLAPIILAHQPQQNFKTIPNSHIATNPNQHDNTKSDKGPRPEKLYENRLSNTQSSHSNFAKILDSKCAFDDFLNTTVPCFNARYNKRRSGQDSAKI